jgi:hypothetical protein
MKMKYGREGIRILQTRKAFKIIFSTEVALQRLGYLSTFGSID